VNGTHVLTFAALSLVLIVIPGPSVVFIVGRALAVGRQAILTTVVGNAAGEYAQVTAVALGLGCYWRDRCWPSLWSSCWGPPT
jgi:threonine/homoserine/homoserine lactone efflux protein